MILHTKKLIKLSLKIIILAVNIIIIQQIHSLSSRFKELSCFSPNNILSSLIESHTFSAKWYTFQGNKNRWIELKPFNEYNFKDKKIAILIVGLFSNQSTLTSLAHFLKKEEFYDHIFCLSYSVLNKNIVQEISQILTKDFSTIICHNSNTQQPIQVDIFAHSFGGLLIRNLLENLSVEKSNTIKDRCKHIFFFGTPHQGLKEEYLKNVTATLYQKLNQDDSTRTLIQLLNLSSDKVLNLVKNLELYNHFVGKTHLLNSLKPISSPSNYYNIVGTNHNIDLPPLNLVSIQLPTIGILHETYKKFNPEVMTDGIVSKDSASLISKGLDPSHELVVHYNHNALIGLHSGPTPHGVPQEIRKWVKDKLKDHSVSKLILLN